MPELPEVEAARSRLARSATGREIEGVEVPDADALKNVTVSDFRSALSGRALRHFRRHGKVLFAHAGDGPRLVVRFGMTGDLPALSPGEEEPEHVRVRIAFADGGRLVFDNPRTFGWMELADDPETHVAANDLGPDALALSRDAFAGILGGTRGITRPALTDQSKLAGIGNLYADEILFRARLRPDAKGTDLSDAQLRDLHAAMREVLETATDRLSDGRDLPDDRLASRRGGDETCPRCGGDLRRESISGRTARFRPACQKMGDGRPAKPPVAPRSGKSSLRTRAKNRPKPRRNPSAGNVLGKHASG